MARARALPACPPNVTLDQHEYGNSADQPSPVRPTAGPLPPPLATSLQPMKRPLACSVSSSGRILIVSARTRPSQSLVGGVGAKVKHLFR